MIRLQIIFFGLVLSLQAFAGGSTTFLYDLQVGEQLTGVDFITKEECSVDVLGRTQKGKIMELTLGVIVGNEVFEPLKVKRRLVLMDVMLYGQVSKEINNVEYHTVTVDAYLKQGRFLGKKSFVLERTVWDQHGYSPKKLIDCRF